MNYEQCIAEIDSLIGRGMTRGLSRMQEACTLLGNPQNRFRSIHIAGTNGKGSTAALCTEILKQAGFKTGLTISPHVEDYRERIQINRQWIPKEILVGLHALLKSKVGFLPLTYFEWTILLAFLHFAESKVDVAVLETGMGGHWDATNVVSPLVTAVTNVSLDHQQYLGNTREEILAEKMQIIKKGSIAWTGIEDEKLLAILRRHCEESGRQIPLFILKDHLRENTDGSFSIFDLKNLHCALPGRHQHKNAGLALGILRSLDSSGFVIPETAIQKGLKEVKWPGRLEIISQKPLVILDCAHNPAGIETVVDYLNHPVGVGLKPTPTNFHLIFGCLNDRPFEEMLSPLLPFFSKIHLALFEEKRNLTREVLEIKLDTLIKNNTSADLFEVNLKSWQSFIRELGSEETVLVTGSLYLVSQIRSFFKRKS